MKLIALKIGALKPEQAVTDVTQAKALGIDAFALNLGTASEPWATDAVAYMFEAAEANDFKLFFSFDMFHFQDPADFIPMFVNYSSSPAHYMHDGLPFSSTFYGATQTFGEASPNEGWQVHFRDALQAEGVETYFVPAFSDAPNGPADFFSEYDMVDGVMSWDSAWPAQANGLVNVTDEIDTEYNDGAHEVDKTFMMGKIYHHSLLSLS